MKTLIQGLIILTVLPFQVFAAEEGVQSFVFEGRAYDSSNNALLDASVDFNFKVYNPSKSCLLYEENQTAVNLATSDGFFALSIGSKVVGGGKRGGSDPGLTMANVFQNASAVTGAAACAYTPAAGDNRILVVTMDPSSGPAEVFPDVPIASIPMAMVAETLQGILPAGFINVNGNVTQANMVTLTGAGDASALHHHDSRYIQSGATANLGNNSYVSGNFGIGTSSPQGDLGFGGTAARTIIVNRNTAGAGSGLTVGAGGAQTGQTDTAGGDLTLSSGIATGSAGSNIEFRTATPGASGTTDRTPSTKMTLTGAGRLGVGVAVPTAYLHLPASVTSAASAPLKFETGTLMTTPEAGAIEYDGTNLYYTNSTPTRRTIATTNDLSGYIKADGTVNFTADQSMNSHKLTNVTDPTAAQDAATRAYVLSTAGGYLPLTGGTLTGGLVGRASTTAAGTAPFKAARGVLMTTPEEGAIEFDGANLYYTNSAGARQTVSTGGGDNLGNHTATQNLVMGTNKVIGGTASGDDVTIESTTHATKGDVVIQPTGGFVGIGTATPGETLHVSRDTSATGEMAVARIGGNFTGAQGSTKMGVNVTLQTWASAVDYLEGVRTGLELAGGAPSATNNYSGFVAKGAQLGAGSTMTTFTGLEVGDSGGAGTVDTQYGVKIANLTKGTSHNYSIYTGTGKSYFGGDVGVGQTSPTAALHLKAGTATASTAPLKLTQGTNLTTPEAGAIEFDGANLYYTNSTPTRRTVATTNDLSGYLPLTGGTLTGGLVGRASTTAAGTAPFKAARGVLMTTPEEGAIEFDGANLYYTNSAGARQTVSTGGGSSGWTDGGASVTLSTSTDSVGIGAAPTAALTLRAGTAAANSAPLKLTQGTNLTTPEAGAIEFDGANLYYTNSTPTRRTIATTNDLSGYIKADGTVNFTADQSMNSHKLTNVTDPTAAQDAATRAYVLSTAGNYLPLTGGTLTGGLVGRASTTAAGTAPFKAARGVLMTTPEEGAIEFDGANLYYTNSAGARQTLSTGGGSYLPLSGGALTGATTLTTANGLNSTSAIMTIANNDVTGTQGQGLLIVAGNDDDDRPLRIQDRTGASELFTVRATGKVGIGTHTPQERFHISTNSSVAMRLESGNASVAAIDLMRTGVGSYDWRIANSSGSLQFMGYSDDDPGTASALLTVNAGGKTGIGETTPTAMLHLKAGTAAANTAPLKLTQGTNLTTPEAGAIEFDGANLYYTNSAGARQTITTGSAVTGSGTQYKIALWSNAGGTALGNSLLGQDSGATYLTLSGTQFIHKLGGANNTFVGDTAGDTVAAGGTDNTGFGENALTGVTTGDNNTAVGSDALITVSTGVNNVAVGHNALKVETGSKNVAVGKDALSAHTTGDENVAIGGAAMESNTGGVSNVAVGYNTMPSGTGSSNVAIGYQAGLNANGASSDNVFLGKNAGPSAAGAVSDKLYIHNTSGVPTIYGDFSNGRVGIGTDNPSQKLHVNGNVLADAYQYTSDRRLKNNIETIKGLEMVLAMRGVTFNWIHSGKPEIGLIAQEVEAVAPDLVVTDPASGMKSVKYGNLVAPLIEATKDLYGICEDNRKSIQKLDREVASLRLENIAKDQKIKNLEDRLDRLEKLMGTSR